MQNTEKRRKGVIPPYKAMREGKIGGRPRLQLPLDGIKHLSAQGHGAKAICRILHLHPLCETTSVFAIGVSSISGLLSLRPSV